MNRTLWIILGAIFVVIFGAAGAVLALLIVSEDPGASTSSTPEPTPKVAPADTPTGRPGDPAAGSGGIASPTLDGRIQALERELKRLREDLAAERAKNKK